MARKHDKGFSERLGWHLDNGTRPDGKLGAAGRRWKNAEFADAVGVSDRTVRYWRNAEALPDDIESIDRELFGANTAYEKDRQQLRTAFNAANSTPRGDHAKPEGIPDSPIQKPERCFGRDEPVEALVTALTGGADAVLYVLGTGGIGKTTVTKKAGTDPRVIKLFGPRRWYVELEAARDAASLESGIVQVIGLNPAQITFPQALAHLSRRTPCLLVLDNLETPWEADRATVETRLRDLASVPGVNILSSLRGGAAPDPQWTHEPIRLDPLDDHAAFQLIHAFAPNITKTDSDLAPLLKELGGIPLAIELVARQVGTDKSLAEVLREWRRRGVDLAADPDLPPDRLTSVARSIDLSLHSSRLKDDGKRLFALLGQLPAGIADEDREELLGGGAFAAKSQLFAVGLAYVPVAGRIDLLPPVRDFARRYSAPIGRDSTEWWIHYERLASTLGARVGQQGGAEATRRLGPEIANVDAAIYAAIAAKALTKTIGIAHGLGALLRFTGLGSAASLRSLSGACHESGDARGEAHCIRCLGDIALVRSDHAAAHQAYEQARRLFRQVDDVLGEVNCIEGLGDIAFRRSDHAAARQAYEHALPLYRQIGDVLGEANCIQSLGDIALRRSDHAAARQAYEQAMVLFRQVDGVVGEAVCVARLGEIALHRSDYAAAHLAYEQAMPLFRQVGDVLGEANCIRSLGDIALRRSDSAVARQAYEQAMALFRQVGNVLGEANCVACLGDIALRHSDYAAARQAYEQALPLFRQVGNVLGEANCVQSLGDIENMEGIPDDARVQYSIALALYSRVQDPKSIGGTHFRLAGITTGKERARHLAAARAAWQSIDRSDLLAMLDGLT